MKSAFPATPKQERQEDPSKTRIRKGSSIVNTSSDGDENAPLIPLNLVDAPSQRAYVFVLYVLLTGWRLYDYYGLISDETESVWQWLKWLFIDAVFLFGIPELRIPWLLWTPTTVVALFMFHAVASGILMFRIPIPFEAWLMGIARMIYDRELAVSERRVKPASLLQNSSLILGKQIVNILPEGSVYPFTAEVKLTASRSAILNPDKQSFCIDGYIPSIELPIYINQTIPKSIEIARINLNTNESEMIMISSKEVKRLKSRADKEAGKNPAAASRILKYQVKQTGIYRLMKVIDESNLEVQRGLSDTPVVPCPSASIRSVAPNKCKGDLSNFNLDVHGTPPLKIKYGKKVNQGKRSDVSLSVHPEEFDDEDKLHALISMRNSITDVSWARSRHVKVPLNESLDLGGVWEYYIAEVKDALNNTIKYDLAPVNGPKQGRQVAPVQTFRVHDIPTAKLNGCSQQQPLKRAKGQYTELPVWLNPTSQKRQEKLKHTLTYMFAPELNDDLKDEDAVIGVQTVTLNDHDSRPRIRDPGSYTLIGISNEYCAGEILEPSSCLLLNPPEPELSISTSQIPHQCAGNSVGLRVSLDFVGTPPFHISWIERREGHKAIELSDKIDSRRKQLEFKPTEPGTYSYEFTTISDQVYHDLPLRGKIPRFEQSVRPTAWARFVDQRSGELACVGQPAEFSIHLSGEAPWTLEYDIIHAGKRQKRSVPEITDSIYELSTPILDKGGEHTITLTSVTDKLGCKIFLEQEARVIVRHESPTAAFGIVDGQRSLLVAGGKKKHTLPVKLTGESPWHVKYLSPKEERPVTQKISQANGAIEVALDGTYEIIEVRDKVCPGSIDIRTNKFDLNFFPTPSLIILENETMKKQSEQLLVKNGVCEGDPDSAEITFTGQAPFHLEYKVHTKPEQGSKFIGPLQKEDVASHVTSIKMDTSQPGTYQYKFLQIGDYAYDSVSGIHLPVIEQRVNSRPTAKFSDTGRTYNYCKEQTVKPDAIPISLTGTPPFVLELGIRHHASTVPEIVKIPNIQSKSYKFAIPQRALSLGTHTVSIRKVRDANGCERASELKTPSVRVNVVNMPTISPMEPQLDFCVGDRISFALAGTPPFNVYYTFEGTERKASTSATTFRRLAERPGEFIVKSLSDKASTDSCRARQELTKIIHPLPSVRISKGKISEVDIHEGGEAELHFDFGGTPPFEFT